MRHLAGGGGGLTSNVILFEGVLIRAVGTCYRFDLFQRYCNTSCGLSRYKQQQKGYPGIDNDI